MAKLNKNQNCLFYINVLRIVLELFTSTFLTSYIVSINPDTALSSGLVDIGIFYGIKYLIYGILYFAVSYFVDKSDRMFLMRIGMIFNTILLVAIVFWGEQISHWVILAGVLSGLTDAFYYPSYLVIKNEINHRKDIKKYNIMSTIATNAVKIIVPVILGYLIDVSSFSNIAIYVMMVALAQIVITFFMKVQKPDGSKFELNKFLKYLNNNKDIKNKIKYTYFNALLNGPKNTYTMIVTVLTIYTFKTNLSLGVFTSIFSFATMLLLMLFRKFESNPKFNKFAVYLSIGIFPFLSCVALVFWLNKPTIIIYNFFLIVALYFSDYFGSNERDNIIRSIHKNEFIAEHQLVVETCQNISKVASYALFVLVGLIASITGFKILLIILIALCPVKFMVMYKQRLIRKGIEKQEAEEMLAVPHDA